MSRLIDLTNFKFGRLLVIDRAGTDNNGHPLWNCICECGNKAVVAGGSLRSGNSSSCGCLQRELAAKRMTIHGQKGTRLFAIWTSMRQRCNDPNYKDYCRYGGRGILVCKEWQAFEPFYEWSLTNGYDPHAPRGFCTIDRINNDGDYEPSNCRWVTQTAQMRNTGVYRNNTSGVKGVHWCRSKNRWIANIGGEGRQIILGRYTSFDDAVASRKAAEEIYWHEEAS